MNRLLKSTIACMICLLAACGNDDKPTINDLSWMIGTWEGVTAEGQKFREEWIKEGTGAFIGKGTGFTPNNDTAFKEVLKVETIEGAIFYVATVPSNPGPVHFKLTSLQNKKAHFENMEHDFPQQIIYTLEKENVIHVELRGKIEGKDAIQELVFQKVN